MFMTTLGPVSVTVNTGTKYKQLETLTASGKRIGRPPKTLQAQREKVSVSCNSNSNDWRSRWRNRNRGI